MTNPRKHFASVLAALALAPGSLWGLVTSKASEEMDVNSL